jgi:hypothetical protein
MAGNSLDLTELGPRFGAWVEGSIGELTSSNCIDLHIDELVGRSANPRQMCDAASLLFQWVHANCGTVLSGKIAMLIVPLRNSESIDMIVPEWNCIHSELSGTPPSIYVMNTSAYLQTDRSRRYITTMDAGMPESLANVSTYYQCWRNPDDPHEDGWSRDVRVVCTAFLHDQTGS